MPIPVGAQLYTLREQMQSPEEIEATLERVAGIGYKIVQLSGFGFEAGSMRDLCDRLGLEVKLTHTAADRILDDTQAVIAEHKILGCPYVGLGGMPWQYRLEGGARRFLEDFRPAMEALGEAGLKFQYHNHSFEFERFGGETIFDVLVRESDPALMGFTLDTYWVQHGGVDVVDLIRRLRGRVDVCHYKDMAIVENQQRYAAVGQGNLNWPGILAAFEEIGAQYAFVEQDDCYGADPVEELRKSFLFLAG